MKYFKFVLPAAFAIPVILIYAATETVGPNVTVDTGQILDVINVDEIDTSGSVDVINGGDSVFWTATKVTLSPGFTATPDSSGYFRAAVDTDFDGRSDVEEGLDSDGDGIPDGFEYEIIDYSQSDSYFSLTDVTKTQDFDGDGQDNWYEYQNSLNPVVGDNPDVFLDVFTARD